MKRRCPWIVIKAAVGRAKASSPVTQFRIPPSPSQCGSKTGKVSLAGSHFSTMRKPGVVFRVPATYPCQPCSRATRTAATTSSRRRGAWHVSVRTGATGRIHKRHGTERSSTSRGCRSDAGGSGERVQSRSFPEEQQAGWATDLRDQKLATFSLSRVKDRALLHVPSHSAAKDIEDRCRSRQWQAESVERELKVRAHGVKGAKHRDATAFGTREQCAWPLTVEERNSSEDTGRFGEEMGDTGFVSLETRGQRERGRERERRGETDTNPEI